MASLGGSGGEGEGLNCASRFPEIQPQSESMHRRALASLEAGLGQGGVECGVPFFFPASPSAGMHLVEAPPIRMPSQLLQAIITLWDAATQGQTQAPVIGRVQARADPLGPAGLGRTDGKVQASPPTCEEDADAFVQREKTSYFVQSCWLPCQRPGEAQIPGSQTSGSSEQRTTGIFLILTLVIGCGGGPQPLIVREQAVLGSRGAVVTASVVPLRVSDRGGCSPSGAVSENVCTCDMLHLWSPNGESFLGALISKLRLSLLSIHPLFDQLVCI